MADMKPLLTRAINKSFSKNELNESLNRFKQNLLTNNIPYITVIDSFIKVDFIFAQSLSDLSLQLKDMPKKPIIFINELRFEDLPVSIQEDIKKIDTNLTCKTIVQIEIFFKVDDLFIKAKYQLDAFYNTLKI